MRAAPQRRKWPEVGEGEAADGDADLLLELGAAAVQGRTALGERAGARDVRVGRGSRSEPLVKGPLCADVDGFSLHTGVWVAARDRERLEKLCRYAGRPAIAVRPWSGVPEDGQTGRLRFGRVLAAAAVRVEGRDRDRLEHLCRYANPAAIGEVRRTVQRRISLIM